MDNWDFGPYGKGLSGYAHYNAAHNHAHKNSGGGGGKRPNNNGGCLSNVIVQLVILVGVIVFLTLIGVR